MPGPAEPEEAAWKTDLKEGWKKFKKSVSKELVGGKENVNKVTGKATQATTKATKAATKAADKATKAATKAADKASKAAEKAASKAASAAKEVPKVPTPQTVTEAISAPKKALSPKKLVPRIPSLDKLKSKTSGSKKTPPPAPELPKKKVPQPTSPTKGKLLDKAKSWLKDGKSKAPANKKQNNNIQTITRAIGVVLAIIIVKGVVTRDR